MTPRQRDTWDQNDLAYTYGQYGTPTARARCPCVRAGARLSHVHRARRPVRARARQSRRARGGRPRPAAGKHLRPHSEPCGRAPRRSKSRCRTRPGGPRDRGAFPTEHEAGVVRARARTPWRSRTCPRSSRGACARARWRSTTRGRPACISMPSRTGDISVQALTKYIGGHSDLLLGSVTLRDATLYRRVGETLSPRMAVSPTIARWHCEGSRRWRCGLDAIERSALDIAAWLAPEPRSRSCFIALPTCPGHESWRRGFHRLERCVLGRLRGAFLQGRRVPVRRRAAVVPDRLQLGWRDESRDAVAGSSRPPDALSRSSCAAVHRAGGCGRSAGGLGPRRELATA